MLQVQAVSKAFGQTRALSEVSFEAQGGEVHALLGENGAGKSTLMKILAGALPLDQGSMALGGDSFAPSNPSEARRRGVAIVYQEPQLCPDLTVAENILLGVEPARLGVIDRSALRAHAVKALERVVAGVERQPIRPDMLVAELPAGDRQLVAIARALGQASPRVLILDEPTSSLTAHDVDRLFDAIGQLRDRGLCILYISHFLEEVVRIADRFTVLRDGCVVGKGAIEGASMTEVVRLMVGQNVDDLFPRSERERGEVLLSLDDLAGRVKPVAASLQLHAGEVVGIAGLVGAGRTELLRTIFGLDPVRSGEIRVGAYSGPASPTKRLAQGLGLLSEDRKGEGLAAGMTIADNLTLSKLTDLGPAGLVLPSRQRAQAAHWIERLNLRCQGPEQRVADLSGGNQQKVALARLLYHDVEVLLLDEPTRGIDVKSRAEVYRVIDELAARGRGLLVVSSYLPELLGVCDRIAVMRRGRLGAARPVAELSQHGLLMEATGA
ncbi:MAG: sugar ABC transporter ATP-binding protein [Deltaproteobacteria bacterium]|nr:MAG: sugar ABC transporter ATP-binding protein [Deltaproteobacteria bacterium]